MTTLAERLRKIYENACDEPGSTVASAWDSASREALRWVEERLPGVDQLAELLLWQDTKRGDYLPEDRREKYRQRARALLALIRERLKG